MDDLVVEGRAEGLAGLLGAEAADAAGVGGGVVGQPAGELLAGGSRMPTTSPLSNSPTTSTMPMASRLFEPDSSAWRAPASTT